MDAVILSSDWDIYWSSIIILFFILINQYAEHKIGLQFGH